MNLWDNAHSLWNATCFVPIIISQATKKHHHFFPSLALSILCCGSILALPFLPLLIALLLLLLFLLACFHRDPLDLGLHQPQHQLLVLHVGLVQAELHPHALEEGEGHPAAGLAGGVLVVHEGGGGGGLVVVTVLAEEEGALEAVLGDQDLRDSYVC